MSSQPFGKIAADYKVILFDAFGVLKNAKGIMPGTPQVLAWLAQRRCDVYVLTNDASRSPERLAESYQHTDLGQLVSPARTISSGLLAKEFLRAKVRTGRVAYLGGPASAFYIEAAGLEAISVAECSDDEDVQCLVLLDDDGFDWQRDINKTLNLLRRRNIPVVVANADAAYPVDSTNIAVAIGSIAKMMETILGRSFIYFGKPDTAMFAYAFATARSNDPSLRKSDCLMVGDTLQTDIHGANAFGIDTVLVLSGNTLPAQHHIQIQTTGILPTFVCDSVFT